LVKFVAQTFFLDLPWVNGGRLATNSLAVLFKEFIFCFNASLSGTQECKETIPNDVTIPWRLLGTLVLVLLGDGVVASVVPKKSKAEGGGWMVIATGWCFAVMAEVFAAIACGSNDAHLNPAVTLGFAVITGNYLKLTIVKQVGISR
jgi:hypothetical protein